MIFSGGRLSRLFSAPVDHRPANGSLAKLKASQAKALTRVLESLAENGLINERDGFYWFPENEQTNDDNQS